MSQESRRVLVTGATGRQGGAVARALLAQGFEVHALTQRPHGTAAVALARRGAKVVKGRFGDVDSLNDALFGVWGVFAVQNPRDADAIVEEEQGRQFARLAREAGVQHFVYASSGPGSPTGLPRFDSRAGVEETIRALKFPTFAILRPVFFMENLVDYRFLHGDKLVAPLDPETRVQVVGVADLGRYAAMLFTRREAFNGAEIDIAGDSVTMPEVAETLSRSLGRTIEYVRIPIEGVRSRSVDLALLLEWFERVGYDVDVAANAARYGIATETFGKWAERAAAAPHLAHARS